MRLLAMNGTFEMSIDDPPTIRSAADISDPLAEHTEAHGAIIWNGLRDEKNTPRVLTLELPDGSKSPVPDFFFSNYRIDISDMLF